MNSPSLLFDRNAGVFLCQFSTCWKYRYSNSFQITGRAISLQKVHLWMDCGKRILWSWTQSIATKIRAATVQSSVWTLQQIFVRQTILFYMYKKSGYIAFASLHNHQICCTICIFKIYRFPYNTLSIPLPIFHCQLLINPII